MYLIWDVLGLVGYGELFTRDSLSWLYPAKLGMQLIQPTMMAEISDLTRHQNDQMNDQIP